MDRKEFLKKTIVGVGGLVLTPVILTACRPPSKPWDGSGPCPISPEETEGPFPSHSPQDLVRNDIVMDRSGVPLAIIITVKKHSDDCDAYPGALVDIWHCDAKGDYSEYGGGGMQQNDYTGEHFLRGRQTTNANGQAAFTSIYPGWYMNRATHIHIEIRDADAKSLLISQIAFPMEISNLVYATEGYKGPAEMSNEKDDIFADSLAGNMADSVTGSVAEGFTLNKTIIVPGKDNE